MKARSQAAALRAAGVPVPFVLMSYYHPILHRGIDAFAQQTASAGIDGAIVPDLPPEEAGLLAAALRDLSLDLIFLLPPTAAEAFVAALRRGMDRRDGA